jgi:hypothetical protein
MSESFHRHVEACWSRADDETMPLIRRGKAHCLELHRNASWAQKAVRLAERPRAYVVDACGSGRSEKDRSGDAGSDAPLDRDLSDTSASMKVLSFRPNLSRELAMMIRSSFLYEVRKIQSAKHGT